MTNEAIHQHRSQLYYFGHNEISCLKSIIIDSGWACYNFGKNQKLFWSKSFLHLFLKSHHFARNTLNTWCLLIKMTFHPYQHRLRKLARAEPPNSHYAHSAATLLGEPSEYSGFRDSTRFSNLCQLIISEAPSAVEASFPARILARFQPNGAPGAFFRPQLQDEKSLYLGQKFEHSTFFGALNE